MITVPNHATVKFKIGKEDFTTLPPEHLKSFSYQRVTNDGGNTFTIVLYDDTAIDLEYKISKQGLNVVFSYGWTMGNWSPEISGTLLNYNLVFDQYGATLTLTGTSSSVKKMAAPAVRSFTNKKISDIVKDIAKVEGWGIGEIEETLDIRGYYSPTSAEVTHKTFLQQNISSAQFIKEELLPYAVSAKTKLGGYQFYLEDKHDKPYVHFHTPKFDGTPVRQYSYTIGRGNTDEVLAFNFAFDGLVQALQSGNAVESLGMDPLSNDLIKLTYSTKTPKTQLKTTGDFTTDLGDMKTIMNTSSETLDSLKAKASAIWSKNNYQGYNADITIIGDPTLPVQRVISVLMLTKSGLPHHTSGIYLVQQITDVIQNGGYTSVLNLIKNGVNIGDAKVQGTNATTSKKQTTPAAKPVPPSTKSTSTHPSLRRGDSGTYVKKIQSALINAGYPLPKYGADGKFGSETETALKKYQTDKHLQVSGVVTPETWTKLGL